MENRDSYHNIIQKILKQYYQLATKQADLQNDSEVSDRLALDKNRGQYLWFRFGWDDKQFVQYIIMYLCIKVKFGSNKTPQICVWLTISSLLVFPPTILF